MSIEVDPRLAHDTARTVEEAKALAAAVDRPNVLIKIPATVEGLPAITEVIAERHHGQRDADLRPRPLPRRDERVPRRAGEGPGERHATCPACTRSRRSSSPGSTPRSTRGSTRSAPTRPRRCAARPAWRTPGWPTRPTRRSSRPRAGRPSPTTAPTRSGRCGPPPGSRTRPTPTRCTSPSSSRPAPSTRCRRRPSTPSPTTARSPATP